VRSFAEGEENEMMDWVAYSGPLLAVVLIAAVVLLSAFIRSYHRRKPAENEITQEPIISSH
jgi:hypothetical protein